MNPQDMEISVGAQDAAAATTDIEGTVVDMKGFDWVLFIAHVGTLTAGQVTTLEAHGGSAADGSDATQITGASQAFADGDSDKCAGVAVIRPQVRYVRPILDRGTANAVLNSIITIKGRGSKLPVTQGAASMVGLTVVTG